MSIRRCAAVAAAWASWTFGLSASARSFATRSTSRTSSSPDSSFSARATIWWAAAEGITTGYVDGTFRPTSPVTRQAWMAFQWRAAGEPAPACGDADFSDVADSHEFVEPITWAACEGITSGYGDGTFRPGATVSRQAAVAFLVRPSLPAWGPLSED